MTNRTFSAVGYPSEIKLRSGLSSICCICYDESDDLKVWYDCNNAPCHTTCLDCFVKFTTDVIRERRCPPLQFTPSHGVVMPCPCCDSLSLRNWNCHILYLLGQASYDRFQVISTEYNLAKDDRSFVCPNPKCGTGFLQDGPVCWEQAVICPECSHHFCAECKNEYHPGRSCFNTTPAELESLLIVKNMKVSILSARAILVTFLSFKKCPSCLSPADKIFGCNHMICTGPYCGAEWCWQCGQLWSLDCSKFHWNIGEDGDSDSEV